MNLTEYLDRMRAARTADELEAAIQAPHKHAFRGRVWDRICKVRIEAGQRICDAAPNGRFVPRYELRRRRLTVCGEGYRVAKGGNGAGSRYVWSHAEDWARGILLAEGFGKRAFHAVWSWAFTYPHRALRQVESALAGQLPDPPFNRLIYVGNGVNEAGVRVDRRAEQDRRAHRPCKCGGWRWDWGCGWNGYANVIQWRCDRCPRVYREYVTNQRLTEIRQNLRGAAA